MDIYGAALTVFLVHGFLFFINMFLKSCSHLPYLYFLENTGLKIEFCRIQWCTTVMNSYFQKSVRLNPKFLRSWFSIGVWVTCLMLPVAVYLVASIAFGNLTKGELGGQPPKTVTLEAVIPGVNLPLEYLGYYISAIVLSSVVHEAGHALAAVREGVEVTGFGLWLLLILPSAFVLLNTSQLQALPPCRSLRVLTAGVWHNIVLSLIAYVLLITMPPLLTPFYSQGAGIYAVDFPEGSPLRGPSGLHPGDVIVKMNRNCDVKTKEHWKQCISVAAEENDKNPGFCVGLNFLLENAYPKVASETSDDSGNCCPDYKTEHLCFAAHYDDDMYEQGLQQSFLKEKMCLPARKAIEESPMSCKTFLSCPKGAALCIHPLLLNDTYLLTVERVSQDPSQRKTVIFMGHPTELWWGVRVSNFVPRFYLISLFASNFPDMTVLLLKFIAVLSSGLAVINLLPIFMFDGQYIINAIAQFIFASFVTPSTIDRITKIIIILCSLNLCVLILSYLF